MIARKFAKLLVENQFQILDRPENDSKLDIFLPKEEVGLNRPPSTNASRFDSIQPPSLPPKSEEVQIRQNALRNEHQNQSIDSCTSFSSGGTFHQRMNGLRNNNLQECSQRYQYTYEEQLLMIYIKQNPEVVSSLGISFPDSTRYAIRDVPWRKVELRAIDDEAPSYQPQAIIYYIYISFSTDNESNHKEKIICTCFPNYKQGRYVKKSQGAPVVLPPSIRFRKTAENVSREMYDKRQNNEEMYGKGGSSLIAAEIRSLKEREEELRRSRSELGLPTLEVR
uniref:Uncharacterized protein n=1 Tax=Heterorhabditis bacteriophora TaxID=37862 RepID=A0A1I7WW32_HETBA